ncbi:MAG: RNA polymerase sigma factor [Ignavibacteriaceae bacterium]
MLSNLKYKLLLKQFKNKVYNYSIYMLRNRMDADDVTQEVLIRLWKNLDNFNLNAAGSYIMRMTHNLCIDYLRRRNISVNREIEIDNVFEETYQNADDVNNPENIIGQENLNRKLKEAIENLPENLKSIFIMYQMQGMKYKEISMALDIPINSVKVYLMRARIKLQKELKEFNNEVPVRC